MTINVDAEYLEELEKKAKRHDFFEGYIKGIEVAFAFAEELMKSISNCKDEPFDKDINVRSKTENSSEKPNNCDGCKEGQEDCYGCPFVEPKDEPRTDIHDLTDCDFCKDRNCKDCEGGKDEPRTCEECEHWNDTEDGCADRHGCKIEPQTDCYKCEDFWNCDGQCDEVKGEPQTDCAWK